jgi:glyoxylase-like metal-dependent hydrolase (beta-lactamase superfamily II)
MTSQHSSSSEVASRVHAIPLIGATAYAILEDQITVIDAGMRGSLPRLHRAIVALGRSPAEIVRFVVTHAHPDHIGGTGGADVLLHPADRGGALRLNAGTLARTFATRRLRSTTDLVDGDILPILGGLRVVHTPGHTPGSVSLYAEREGLLFSGDALWRDPAGTLHQPNRYWSEDLRTARSSVGRLAELDIGTILFGHLPPLENATGALRELASRWR